MTALAAAINDSTGGSHMTALRQVSEMYKLGITGGISSGKSTVACTLKELGAIVIDADEVAHRIIEPGQPAWQDIVDYFGPEVLDANNRIDRPRLGDMVFNDHEKLVMLNRFTHPRVIEYYRTTLAELAESNSAAVVVLEIPLLFESGMQNMCDEVWVIWLDEDNPRQAVDGAQWLYPGSRP